MSEEPSDKVFVIRVPEVSSLRGECSWREVRRLPPFLHADTELAGVSAAVRAGRTRLGQFDSGHPYLAPKAVGVSQNDPREPKRTIWVVHGGDP